MNKFDRVYYKCTRQEKEYCPKGEFTDYFLADHKKYKVGDIRDPYTPCTFCKGKLVITKIETLFTSDYLLVNCLDCKTEEIVKANLVGSNVGWVCPKCGPDCHGKGGSHGSRQIFYNPNACTPVEKVLRENQYTLDKFIGVDVQ